MGTVVGSSLIGESEGARAFFVFGDSLVDNGNNNYLATTARTDAPFNSGLESFNSQFDPHYKGHLMEGLRTMFRWNQDNKSGVECIGWLCSLSEPEIDMLISLKLLIIQRTKMTGYVDLEEKFNLKIIRAIAVVLMEHLKEELKYLLLDADMDKSASFLDACNLLKCDNECTTTIEELITNIGADIQECEETISYKRKHTKQRRRMKKDSKRLRCS